MRWVIFDRYNVELSAASLRGHLATQHRVFRAKILDEGFLEDRPSRTYEAHALVDGVDTAH